MPQAAAVPPKNTPRSEPGTAATSLTVAAWNRHPQPRRLRGLAHWPRWLRDLPEPARPIALARLFGALFMALPGAALVVFVALHAGAALAAATLLLVATHATLHAMAAWSQARTAMSSPWPQRLEAPAPALLSWTSLLPFATVAAPGAKTLLGASVALLLLNARLTAYGRHRPWQRPLHVATATLLAATLAGQAVLLSLPARAALLAGAACIGVSVAVQLRAGTHRITGHLLLVLGSLCAAFAVALQVGSH